MSDGKWADVYTNTATVTPTLIPAGMSGFLLHGICIDGATGGNTFSITLDGTVALLYTQAAGQSMFSKDWTLPVYSPTNPVIVISGVSLTFWLYFSVH